MPSKANLIELDRMSLEELKELNRRLTKAIDQFGTRKKTEALQVLEALALEHGFTLAELAGYPRTMSRRPAIVKYANPDDASQIWSGRGLKPLWVVKALNGGKSLDDRFIKN